MILYFGSKHGREVDAETFSLYFTADVLRQSPFGIAVVRRNGDTPRNAAVI